MPMTLSLRPNTSAAFRVGGLAAAFMPLLAAAQFTQTPLPYPYTALEPQIDAMTMELHSTRHHESAVDGLKVQIKTIRSWPI